MYPLTAEHAVMGIQRTSAYPRGVIGVLDAAARSDASAPQMFRETSRFLEGNVAEIRTLAVVRSTRATLRHQVMIANFLAIIRGNTGTHHINIRAVLFALGGPSPYTAQTLSHGIILIVSGFQSSDRRNQGTLYNARKLRCIDVNGQTELMKLFSGARFQRNP